MGPLFIARCLTTGIHVLLKASSHYLQLLFTNSASTNIWAGSKIRILHNEGLYELYR
jgi:hypothetical protein